MAESHKPAHILVIGGTGQCGQVFIPRALEANHELTLFARNPSKFPENITNHRNVNIVQGEFTDIDAFKQALSKGAMILVSFAGPAVFNKGPVITQFYERLFPLLPDSTIRRCLILSTPSYQVPEDKETLKWYIGVKLGIRLLANGAYRDIIGLSEITAALPEDIEWTLFRVPQLDNGEAKLTRASFLGDGSDSMFLSRKSIAVWLLQEIEEGKWVRKAPLLSNPSFM